MILSYLPAWLGEPRLRPRPDTRAARGPRRVASRRARRRASPGHRPGPGPALRGVERARHPAVLAGHAGSLGRHGRPARRRRVAAGRGRDRPRPRLRRTGRRLPRPRLPAAVPAAVPRHRAPARLRVVALLRQPPVLRARRRRVPGHRSRSQPVLGRRNPVASPAVYGPQVPFVRDLTAGDARRVGATDAAICVLDEWNLSAAGFDRRHDTAEGAAFAAGVLAELQDAGPRRGRLLPGQRHARRAPASTGRCGPTAHRSRCGGRSSCGSTCPRSKSRSTVRQHPATRCGRSRARTADVGRRADGRLRRRRASGAHRPRHRSRRAATVRRIDDAHAAPSPEPLSVAGSSVELDLPGTGVALVELDLSPLPT